MRILLASRYRRVLCLPQCRNLKSLTFLLIRNTNPPHSSPWTQLQSLRSFSYLSHCELQQSIFPKLIGLRSFSFVLVFVSVVRKKSKEAKSQIISIQNTWWVSFNVVQKLSYTCCLLVPPGTDMVSRSHYHWAISRFMFIRRHQPLVSRANTLLSQGGRTAIRRTAAIAGFATQRLLSLVTVNMSQFKKARLSSQTPLTHSNQA